MKYEYIVTYIGKKIYPLDPEPDAICIEDIAHALSNKCRFGGHTREFYSVAQHSIVVANFCGYPMHGLMHDAAEAYLPDVASPIKPLFPDFAQAEHMLMEAIYARFDLPDVSAKEKKIIKVTDISALIAEWESLIDNPNKYELIPAYQLAPRFHWRLNGCWHPVEAERVFLKLFHELYHKEV